MPATGWQPQRAQATRRFGKAIVARGTKPATQVPTAIASIEPTRLNVGQVSAPATAGVDAYAATP